MRLVLVGDGPMLAELRASAQSLGVAGQVVFAGAHDDVAGLLPALDIFALPSRTEGLSIALLEACAAQRAVVATAVGGNPEIIEDGVTGRLFASEDQARLCALLLELLGDAPQRQRLGEAARRWVQANASVEAMASRYREVYTAKRGDVFVYEPGEFYIGSLPVTRLPMLADFAREKFLSAQAIPEDVRAAWPKLTNVAVEGNVLKLTMP